MILVVHPDPSTRGALAEALRSDGHPTVTAAAVDDALELLAERVDGVLCALALPNAPTAGLSLLARLREHQPWAARALVASGSTKAARTRSSPASPTASSAGRSTITRSARGSAGPRAR